MYTKWTTHLDDRDKSDFSIAVSSSQPVLKRLRDLVEEENKSSDQKMRERDNYKTDSWAYAQADFLGEQRAYSKVLKLLNNIIRE